MRLLEVLGGRGHVTLSEEHLTQESFDTSGLVLQAGCGGSCEEHRFHRPRGVAGQLAKIGQTAVGLQARAKGEQLVELPFRLVVLAHFDVGVHQGRQRNVVVGAELRRFLGSGAGRLEAMQTDVGDRRATQRFGVLRLVFQDRDIALVGPIETLGAVGPERFGQRGLGVSKHAGRVGRGGPLDPERAAEHDADHQGGEHHARQVAGHGASCWRWTTVAHLLLVLHEIGRRHRRISPSR